MKPTENNTNKILKKGESEVIGSNESSLEIEVTRAEHESHIFSTSAEINHIINRDTEEYQYTLGDIMQILEAIKSIYLYEILKDIKNGAI